MKNSFLLMSIATASALFGAARPLSVGVPDSSGNVTVTIGGTGSGDQALIAAWANGDKGGFDVLNDERHIYVEMKNKHNTMNSASSQKTYIKMQGKILEDDKATCMLVEIIAKRSQDIKWNIRVDGQNRSHKQIRRVSIDKFYEIVFGQKDAFFKLCKALPDILDDVVSADESAKLQNTVYDELDKTDFYKSLYLLAFQTYEGFDRF